MYVESALTIFYSESQNNHLSVQVGIFLIKKNALIQGFLFFIYSSLLFFLLLLIDFYYLIKCVTFKRVILNCNC